MPTPKVKIPELGDILREKFGDEDSCLRKKLQEIYDQNPSYTKMSRYLLEVYDVKNCESTLALILKNLGIKTREPTRAKMRYISREEIITTYQKNHGKSSLEVLFNMLKKDNSTL